MRVLLVRISTISHSRMREYVRTLTNLLLSFEDMIICNQKSLETVNFQIDHFANLDRTRKGHKRRSHQGAVYRRESKAGYSRRNRL